MASGVASSNCFGLTSADVDRRSCKRERAVGVTVGGVFPQMRMVGWQIVVAMRQHHRVLGGPHYPDGHECQHGKADPLAHKVKLAAVRRMPRPIGWTYSMLGPGSRHCTCRRRHRRLVVRSGVRVVTSTPWALGMSPWASWAARSTARYLMH